MLRTIGFITSLVVSVFLFSFQSVAQLPTATLSGSQTVCQGVLANLTVTLTGTAPWNFSYSNGSVTNTVVINQTPYTLTVTPAATTNYIPISVSNTNGVGTVNGSSTVQVIPSNNVNISIQGPNPLICSSGSTVLTANTTSSVTIYQWFKNDTVLSGANKPDLLITSSGNYKVLIATSTNGIGCPLWSSNMQINAYIPEITPNSTSSVTTLKRSICIGAKNILKSRSGFKTYEWSINGAIVNNTADSIDANVFGSGTYSLKIRDDKGCSYSSSPNIVYIGSFDPKCTTLGYNK